MAEVRIPIRAAFTFIEALNDAEEQQVLRWNLSQTAPAKDSRVAKSTDESTFGALSAQLFGLAYGLWIPRLMTTKTVDAINAALAERPVTLACTPFVRSLEQFCIGTTAGVKNDLRDRVVYDYGKLYRNPAEPMDVELFRELCLEATVDWVIKSTNARYEVRKCAWCGLWFEPQLSRRSRFCDSRCRQDFNNARVGKATATFHCYKCRETHSIENFSGLGLSDNPFDENDARSTPISFTSLKRKEGIYGGDPTCVACIRQYYPEWTRYIAPITSKGRGKQE